MVKVNLTQFDDSRAPEMEHADRRRQQPCKHGRQEQDSPRRVRGDHEARGLSRAA